MRKAMLVVHYEAHGMQVVVEQPVEDVLKRIQYGEIVTLCEPIDEAEFIAWCKAQGTNVAIREWEGMAGTQMWIEDEDGDGYDVDGNKIDGSDSGLVGDDHR